MKNTNKVYYFLNGDEVIITDMWLDEYGKIVVHIVRQSDIYERNCYFDKIEVIDEEDVTCGVF